MKQSYEVVGGKPIIAVFELMQMSFWGMYSALDGFIVKLVFFVPNLRAHKQIGPHSWEFCQIATGLLLSVASLEKHGNRYCLSFQHEYRNHEFFYDVKSMELLRSLILPFLCASMHYKLGIKQ